MTRRADPPPIGRPTDYHPSYANLIRQLRKEGRDIAAFCSAIGISRKTYYNWKNSYPEFAEACEVAAEDSKAYLGEVVLQGAQGKLSGVNTQAILAIYDRQHGSVRHSDEVVKTEINIGSMNVLSSLTDAQLNELADRKYKELREQKSLERIIDGSDES